MYAAMLHQVWSCKPVIFQHVRRCVLRSHISPWSSKQLGPSARLLRALYRFWRFQGILYSHDDVEFIMGIERNIGSQSKQVICDAKITSGTCCGSWNQNSGFQVSFKVHQSSLHISITWIWSIERLGELCVMYRHITWTLGWCGCFSRKVT